LLVITLSGYYHPSVTTGRRAETRGSALPSGIDTSVQRRARERETPYPGTQTGRLHINRGLKRLMTLSNSHPEPAEREPADQGIFLAAIPDFQ